MSVTSRPLEVVPRSPLNRRGSRGATVAELVPPEAGSPHLESGGSLGVVSLKAAFRDESG